MTSMSEVCLVMRSLGVGHVIGGHFTVWVQVARVMVGVTTVASTEGERDGTVCSTMYFQKNGSLVHLLLIGIPLEKILCRKLCIRAAWLCLGCLVAVVERLMHIGGRRNWRGGTRRRALLPERSPLLHLLRMPAPPGQDTEPELRNPGEDRSFRSQLS